MDTTGQTVLIFKDISQKEKVIIWKASILKDEMLTHFPHLDKMFKYINQRISDDGAFKTRLIEYIEHIHGRYLSGEINQEEFREALCNPDPALPSY